MNWPCLLTAALSTTARITGAYAYGDILFTPSIQNTHCMQPSLPLKESSIYIFEFWVVKPQDNEIPQANILSWSLAKCTTSSKLFMLEDNLKSFVFNEQGEHEVPKDRGTVHTCPATVFFHIKFSCSSNSRPEPQPQPSEIYSNIYSCYDPSCSSAYFDSDIHILLFGQLTCPSLSTMKHFQTSWFSPFRSWCLPQIDVEYTVFISAKCSYTRDNM